MTYGVNIDAQMVYSNSMDIKDFENDLGVKSHACIVCKKICKNKILLFTPRKWEDNTIYINDKSLWCYGNEYNEHKSLWTEEDFQDWTTLEGGEDYKDSFFVMWEKK